MSEIVETIRFTADVVAIDSGGRVLLIERGWPPYRGKRALRARLIWADGL